MESVLETSKSTLYNKPFDNNLKFILEKLISYGHENGADFIEIFLENVDNLSLLGEEEEITSINPSFGKGAGVRIFKNQKDSFVSTNNITEIGLKNSIILGLEMLEIDNRLKNKDLFNGLEELRDFGLTKNNWINDLPSLGFINNKIIEANRSLKVNNKIDVCKCSYSRNWQEILIAASDGTFVRDIRLHQTYGLNAIAKDRDHRSTSSRRLGSTDKPNDIAEWDHNKTANDVIDSSMNMLYADYVEAGQMPVVLANKFGGVIFHEACGHLLETTQIERGTTPFADKLGERIAHDSLTAIDEGISKEAFGSFSVDDEGMEPKRTVLIENGILKNFISDRAGELRTGHKRTGSGRRQNYSYASASRMRNTYIASGDYSPNDLIDSISKGLYCKSMGGGSVGGTGQFNFAVEEAYLIKNGKLKEPVKGATLIGEAKEVMPRISMCANDISLAAGFCGSVSGNVNVTVGQPHIKVDSITVGGR